MEITIIQDSRQQIGKDKHVLEYFEKNNIKVIRTKMFVGDYTLLHNQSICIDRKKDMLEIAGNICNSDEHIRFRNELINAKDNNIKLYILIEDEYIYNLEGVKYYKCPRYKSSGYNNGIYHKKGDKMSQVNFETLGKAMKTMEEKYGCVFCFAKHNEFGKKIIELLIGDKNE